MEAFWNPIIQAVAAWVIAVCAFIVWRRSEEETLRRALAQRFLEVFGALALPATFWAYLDLYVIRWGIAPSAQLELRKLEEAISHLSHWLLQFSPPTWVEVSCYLFTGLIILVVFRLSVLRSRPVAVKDEDTVWDMLSAAFTSLRVMNAFLVGLSSFTFFGVAVAGNATVARERLEGERAELHKEFLGYATRVMEYVEAEAREAAWAEAVGHDTQAPLEQLSVELTQTRQLADDYHALIPIPAPQIEKALAQVLEGFGPPEHPAPSPSKVPPIEPSVPEDMSRAKVADLNAELKEAIAESKPEMPRGIEEVSEELIDAVVEKGVGPLVKGLLKPFGLECVGELAELLGETLTEFPLSETVTHYAMAIVKKGYAAYEHLRSELLSIRSKVAADIRSHESPTVQAKVAQAQQRVAEAEARVEARLAEVRPKVVQALKKQVAVERASFTSNFDKRFTYSDETLAEAAVTVRDLVVAEVDSLKAPDTALKEYHRLHEVMQLDDATLDQQARSQLLLNQEKRMNSTAFEEAVAKVTEATVHDVLLHPKAALSGNGFSFSVDSELQPPWAAEAEEAWQAHVREQARLNTLKDKTLSTEPTLTWSSSAERQTFVTEWLKKHTRPASFFTPRPFGEPIGPIGHEWEKGGEIEKSAVRVEEGAGGFWKLLSRVHPE